MNLTDNYDHDSREKEVEDFLSKKVLELLKFYEVLAGDYDMSIDYIRKSRNDVSRLYSEFVLGHLDMIGSDSYNHWYPIFSSKFNRIFKELTRNEY
jgi:hypothetical protein